MNTRQDNTNKIFFYCFVCNTTLEDCYCYGEYDNICNHCNLPIGECECHDDYCYYCGESPTFCECYGDNDFEN